MIASNNKNIAKNSGPLGTRRVGKLSFPKTSPKTSKVQNDYKFQFNTLTSSGKMQIRRES